MPSPDLFNRWLPPETHRGLLRRGAIVWAVALVHRGDELVQQTQLRLAAPKRWSTATPSAPPSGSSPTPCASPRAAGCARSPQLLGLEPAQRGLAARRHRRSATPSAPGSATSTPASPPVSHADRIAQALLGLSAQLAGHQPGLLCFSSTSAKKRSRCNARPPKPACACWKPSSNPTCCSTRWPTCAP